MSEDSQHGKLNPEDQRMNGRMFMILLTATLLVAFTVIYTIASVKHGWGWQPFGHEPIDRFTFEHSTF